MMIRLKMILFILAIVTTNFFSQSTSVRYLDEIFSTYDLTSNIVYGTGSKNVMDIYNGKGDAETKRPLVIFIHGGGFKDGDKVSNFGTRVCGGFARRGYIVASINYRTTSTQNTDQQSFEAMIKAVQDAKAAVRYFRKNASQYGVDTTQIFVTGSSAGCITALHMAYMDANELPSYVSDPLLKDIEGTSGNPGYSSKIHGVINNWGAITDTSWIRKGDVPVYCVHGTNDQTVYYEQIPADGPFAYGSKHIIAAVQRLNIPSGLRTFNNTGHTLDNSAAKQDSAIKDFSKWLFGILKKETSSEIGKKVSEIPSHASLYQNYPNPFNPSTTIEYNLPHASYVNISVYDSIGERITEIDEGFKNVGEYKINFNGESLSSGTYLYCLRLGNSIITKKMTLLK